jgi:hypothetical protein
MALRKTLWCADSCECKECSMVLEQCMGDIYVTQYYGSNMEDTYVESEDTDADETKEETRSVAYARGASALARVKRRTRRLCAQTAVGAARRRRTTTRRPPMTLADLKTRLGECEQRIAKLHQA